MMRALVVASLLIDLSGSANAQQSTVSRAAFPSQQDGVRVHVNINVFVPAPMDDSQAVIKAQEQTRRALYESAGRECEILRATIASDCRLESINVNMNRYSSPKRQEGFNASGGFGYRVTLK